jgi:DNA-binding transcriptional LysR family regulator
LSFGPTHLAPVFGELAHRHPLLHVHAAYGDRFFDLVGEGFDAGVRVGCLPDSSLVARCICAIRGKLVASPGYIAAHRAPQTPEDLLNHEALMQGTESWRFVHGGKTVVVRPRGRFKADNGAALLAAALAGLGVAGLPDFLIEAHIASGALIPLLGDYPPPEAGLYVVLRPATFPLARSGCLSTFSLSTSGLERARPICELGIRVGLSVSASGPTLPICTM